jgi:DNA polymerase III subunit delta'
MWQVIGQSKIVDLLQRALENGKLSHAYLLIGPPQVGKMTLALDLAKVLNCQAEKSQRPCGECAPCKKIAAGKHADVQIVELNPNAGPEETKEKTEIGIGQIKDLLHAASLPPFEGNCRVFVIDEAGHLSPDAANCLLKTLEEPTGKVVFILLTANAQLIPATVISRCQRLNLSRLKISEIESALIHHWQIEPEKARLFSRLSHGCVGWAVEAVRNANLLAERQEKFEKMLSVIRSDYVERFAVASQLALQFGRKRESVYETLDTWTGWWRDLLLVKIGCHSDIVSLDYLPALAEMAGAFSLVQIKSTIQNISAAGEQLKLNANSRLVMEALMLNIPRPALGQGSRSQVEVKNA